MEMIHLTHKFGILGAYVFNLPLEVLNDNIKSQLQFQDFIHDEVI